MWLAMLSRVSATTRFTFIAFTAIVLLCARIEAVTNVSNLDDYGEDWEAKDAMAGEVPVGRTLLLLHLLKQKLYKLHDFDKVTLSPPFAGCICVPFYLCDANSNVITDGGTVIDFRNRFTNRRCTGDIEVCCYLRGSNTVPIATQPPTAPPTQPTTQPPVTIATTLPTTPPAAPTLAPTIPTTQSPITIPTTQPTVPTTRAPVTLPTTTPAPIVIVPPVQPIIQQQIPICTCVPIYQCAAYTSGAILNPGTVVNPGAVAGTGVIDPRQQARQYLNTCAGAFVCCSYASAGIPVQVAPSTFPPYTLPNTIPTTQPPPTTTTLAPIVLPPIVIGQSCVCTLISACSLGYISVSGAGSIDPRLILGRQGQPSGTCNAANSMCCKLGQQQDNTAIIPFSNQAATNFAATIITKNAGSPNECQCISVDSCAEGNAVTYDGVGAIDPRFGPCASATLVCCRVQNRMQKAEGSPMAKQFQQIVVPPAPPSLQQICGTRETTYAGGDLPVGTAYFAEFPWMALLLIRKPSTNDVFQCGGSLINSRTILTAAHCVLNCEPGTLIARLGEYNTAATNEPLPFQEIGAQSVVINPQYFAGGLYHDVALVVLSKAVNYAANVRPVCLPTQAQVFAAGTRCFASGWGRSAFDSSGQYQTTLRKVDLPIVDNANCQTRLRATRLGQLFQLHDSFICAGGEASKDTCYKDGGGPLVCQDANTAKFIQAGIISWGIGCGSNTPGVYANVAQHRQWIDQQLAANGISA